MTQKKNAQPRNAELSAPSNGVNATTAQVMTPRQERVLQALAGTTSWIAREAIDRIAGASNGPDVIARLRHKLGIDAIEMERVEVIDRDGRPAKPGHYRLTDTGRRRLAEMGAK
ncbi:hypothetical protein [Comamonas antarctica]|uniref:hypothetical protein n=1 Tax=Comamonas antarctica TaxID=2743470 RepID=UPI0028EB9BD2|nr:hypothetical protein [Comamonas antarctica]